MPWARRHHPHYGAPYRNRGWGRRPRYRSGNSCLRDACLLETGCCIGEALEDNCLMAGLMLLPTFAAATLTALRRPTGEHRPADHHLGRVAAVLLSAIRVYQRDISAHRAPCCRFSPGCSAYAAEAIERHGALRGTALAARRLLRCRPGGARGADPVPA